MSLSLGDVEIRRSWIDQVAENASRQARVTCYVTSTGAGENKLTTPVYFGVGFFEVPAFASGYEVLSSLVSKQFPAATTFVWEWLYNTQHTLCVGCKVGLVVDDAYTNSTGHSLKHHLTFMGEAIKLLPPGAT